MWMDPPKPLGGGLPRRLTSAVGGRLGVGPEDGLKPMRGAQGLLTQGLGERSEDAVVAVELPSSKYLSIPGTSLQGPAEGA